MTLTKIPYDSVTVTTSCKMIERVQKVITQDRLRTYYDAIHEVHLGHGGIRLGYYRLIIGFTGKDGKRKATSHIFDLQLYLDMQDEWKGKVDEQTRKLMREVAPNVITHTSQ